MIITISIVARSGHHNDQILQKLHSEHHIVFDWWWGGVRYDSVALHMTAHLGRNMCESMKRIFQISFSLTLNGTVGSSVMVRKDNCRFGTL